MDDDERPQYEDEAAGEAGDWIEAVHLKFRAMMIFAVGVLAEVGAFADADAWLAAELDAEPVAGLFEEQLAEDSLGTVGLIAERFLESVEVPTEKEPLTAEVAAATLLICLAEYHELLATVIEKAGRDDAEIDFDDICQLVWIGAEIGSLGEVFRSRQGGFDRHHETAKAQRRGAALGGARKAATADKWRRPMIERAKQMREKQPHLGQKALAKRLSDAIPDLPEWEQILAEIRKAEKRGDLPRSTKNPANKGEKS